VTGGDLGPGWSVRVRTRTVLLHGKERQQKDAFYCSPAGDTYNSRRKARGAASRPRPLLSLCPVFCWRAVQNPSGDQWSRCTRIVFAHMLCTRDHCSLQQIHVL